MAGGERAPALNVHYSGMIAKMEAEQRRVIDDLRTQEQQSINEATRADLSRLRACPSSLAVLAEALSARTRPSTASAAQPRQHMSISERLARIAAARPQVVNSSSSATAASTPATAVNPAAAASRRERAPASARQSKVQSLRLLVSGTPEQQTARRVYEAEKVLTKTVPVHRLKPVSVAGAHRAPL